MRSKLGSFSIFHSSILIPPPYQSSLFILLALGCTDPVIVFLIVIGLYVIQLQILVLTVTLPILLPLRTLVNMGILAIPYVVPLNP